MSELLAYSLFQDVLFPADLESHNDDSKSEELRLQRVIRYNLELSSQISEIPIVIFDFETTGLDSREDAIIEFGAQKFIGMKPVEQFHSLINPQSPIPDFITKLSGIDDQMLADQPTMAETLPGFLEFIQGSLLVAHNAEFDMAFLQAACRRQGYQLNWPCLCTLKMARVLLNQLESKNLDKLAEHFGLQFESRHRSMGDVKVTGQVLVNMLALESQIPLKTWQDLLPFSVTRE